MMGGVATTLIKNSTLSGSFNKELLILETDERSFPLIRKQLPGRRMGITNLQKDQVQRNGDPDFILRKFQNAVSSDMTLYLNNEEPRSCSLDAFAKEAVYFSVAENSRTYKNRDPYRVTMPCPRCGHPIAYSQYNLANIGPFQCTGCDYATSDTPQVLIHNVDYDNNTFTCGSTVWRVPYNNPFYIYNFAMVIAICRSFSLSDDLIQKGFSSFKNPASHEDILHYRGKEIHYLRGKQENPEALQSQLDIIAADKRKKAIYVGLYPVTDFYPHYSGTFYFFDCDFSPIVESCVERYVAFSTPVAGDIASRIILAGAEKNAVRICMTDDPNKIFADIDKVETDIIYVLTNTTHAKLLKDFFRKGGADHA